jgi:hypothetical protein
MSPTNPLPLIRPDRHLLLSTRGTHIRDEIMRLTRRDSELCPGREVRRFAEGSKLRLAVSGDDQALQDEAAVGKVQVARLVAASVGGCAGG